MGTSSHKAPCRQRISNRVWCPGEPDSRAHEWGLKWQVLPKVRAVHGVGQRSTACIQPFCSGGQYRCPGAPAESFSSHIIKSKSWTGKGHSALKVIFLLC